jgi:hypothetical protein
VRSTVALKAVMATSGLIMALFLVVHMYGNLKLFSGRVAFDDRNDGDSVHRLSYDTIKGGDFRSRESNVYRLAQVSVDIIDQAQPSSPLPPSDCSPGITAIGVGECESIPSTTYPAPTLNRRRRR